MSLKVIMEFVAKNPPSILILGGILGWILCGFTNIEVFCSYWMTVLMIGVALQLLWLAFRFGK
ncbi:MAG: hypothetical protein CVT89_03680 [Candidatus Altiarchaeales archaeon HGW-Altiarchaeales-2]|nr:MAG: hypothetical protein CVT89_03680 [Candidatus Altiarchaeales archaeon HGW-Altiarchaeales-2]